MHGRRKILHFNVTEHPTCSWIVQQLREAFPEDRAPQYLVLDRDSKFKGDVAAMLERSAVRLLDLLQRLILWLSSPPLPPLRAPARNRVVGPSHGGPNQTIKVGQFKVSKSEAACVVCGGPLTGRQTRFCSEECAKAERRWKTRASRPARDHVCRCGTCGREMPIARPRRDDRPPALEFARAPG